MGKLQPSPCIPCKDTSVRLFHHLHQNGGPSSQNVEDSDYGHHGSKYGQGEPPSGWPEDIDWRGFEGATPLAEITSIMVSLLEAVGLDPNTHIESNENVEENQNYDDDKSLMEIV